MTFLPFRSEKLGRDNMERERLVGKHQLPFLVSFLPLPFLVRASFRLSGVTSNIIVAQSRSLFQIATKEVQILASP